MNEYWFADLKEAVEEIEDSRQDLQPVTYILRWYQTMGEFAAQIVNILSQFGR